MAGNYYPHPNQLSIIDWWLGRPVSVRDDLSEMKNNKAVVSVINVMDLLFL